MCFTTITMFIESISSWNPLLFTFTIPWFSNIVLYLYFRPYVFSTGHFGCYCLHMRSYQSIWRLSLSYAFLSSRIYFARLTQVFNLHIGLEFCGEIMSSKQEHVTLNGHNYGLWINRSKRYWRVSDLVISQDSILLGKR